MVWQSATTAYINILCSPFLFFHILRRPCYDLSISTKTDLVCLSSKTRNRSLAISFLGIAISPRSFTLRCPMRHLWRSAMRVCVDDTVPYHLNSSSMAITEDHRIRLRCTVVIHGIRVQSIPLNSAASCHVVGYCTISVLQYSRKDLVNNFY